MTDDATEIPEDDAAAEAKPSSFSMRRVVPSPWVDCPSCGWRHYPDSSRKKGPQIPTVCASCGQAIALGDGPAGPAA